MVSEVCRDWKEKLIAELYGELATEPEREEVRAHVRHCEACSAAWEELTAAREALRATDFPVPAPPVTRY